MPFTHITKPAVGDDICIEFAWDTIDDLDDHEARLALVEGASVPNASFELDDGTDPTGWTKTVVGGGVGALETTTPLQGKQSVKATVTTSGDSVAYTMDNYVPVGEGERIEGAAHLLASVAGVQVDIDLLWYYWTGTAYAAASTASSSVYSSASNPTTRRHVRGQTVAPGGANPAQFYRVRFKATHAAAGSVIFDAVTAGVYRGPVYLTRALLTPSGTTYTLVAGTHHQVGECPVAALIAYQWNGEALGSNITMTVTGNGKTALAAVLTPAGEQHAGQVWVELNESNEFEVVPTGGTPDTNGVYVVGFEV